LSAIGTNLPELPELPEFQGQVRDHGAGLVKGQVAGVHHVDLGAR
jgi:hypothetical protein